MKLESTIVRSVPVQKVPPPNAGDGNATESKLLAAVMEYESRVKKGERIDRQQLIAQFPTLAEELEPLLRGLEALYGGKNADSISDSRADQSSFADVESPTNDPFAEKTLVPEKTLGDYQILGEIGKGGMGVVYEARQISLDRRVALKVLPMAGLLSSKLIARFENEARAAAHLNHPHIVSVFGVGCERGVYYYSMQFIEGRPLSEVLHWLRAAIAHEEETSPCSFGSEKSKQTKGPAFGETVGPRQVGPRPEGKDSWNRFTKAEMICSHDFFHTIARLGADAAEALHHAHESGVIHRDIKPSNLLLDHEGAVWITDFGLARFQSDPSMTKTGHAMGSVGYMSPEQTTGQWSLVDQRTDVYSLGVTLYELLTLEPAYQSGNFEEFRQKMEHHDPPAPRRLNPAIPMDLETIILKAIAKPREDRYASALDMVDDLLRFIGDKPIQAKRPSLIDVFFKWTRRHRLVAGTAAACLLIVCVVLSGALMVVSRQSAQTERAYQQFRNYAGVDLLLAQASRSGPGQLQWWDRWKSEKLINLDSLSDTTDLPPDIKVMVGWEAGLLNEEHRGLDAALKEYEKTIALAEESELADTLDREALSRLAGCYERAGELLLKKTKTDRAVSYMTKAGGIYDRLIAENPNSEVYQARKSIFLTNLGWFQHLLGQRAEAETSLQEARRFSKRILSGNPTDGVYATIYMRASAYLLHVLKEQDLEASIDLCKETIAHQKVLLNKKPEDWICNSDLARLLGLLGSLYYEKSQTLNERDKKEWLIAAKQSYDRAIKMQRSFARKFAHRTGYETAQQIGFLFNQLGNVSYDQGNVSQAEEYFRRAAKQFELLVALNQADHTVRNQLAAAYSNLAQSLGDDRPTVDARTKLLFDAIKQQETAMFYHQGDEEYRRQLDRHYVDYLQTLFDAGEFADSLNATSYLINIRKGRKKQLVELFFNLYEKYKILTNTDPAIQSDSQNRALGFRDAAIQSLKEAIRPGSYPPRTFFDGSHFDSIRDDPEFHVIRQQLVGDGK